MLRWIAMTLILGATAAGAASAAAAPTTHPFSVHDMLAMDRISDPRVSPDGKLVVFTVRVTDLAANKGRTSLWLASVDGSGARRLTSSEASDSQGRWSPDGTAIYFVSTRSGSAQVWRIPVDGGEAQQVTHLPLDVDALTVAPGGRTLLFGLAVFPGKTPDETKAALDAREKSQATGMVFDSLFIRHWDTWENGTRNHLFAYDVASGKATDLMAGMPADCPTKPFGDAGDYAIAPDGKSVVFSAKDMGDHPSEEAWSTNFDLFRVPADGSAAPVRITTNPAWDGSPRFSPDGTRLAYLAMSRPGYEADRFEIVVRELATGSERKFTLRADGGPRSDRSPSEIVWAADGRELYCTADNHGQHALFAVDAATGKTRMVVEEGTIDGEQSAGDRVLYGMNSLHGPEELYTVGRDGTGSRRITHLNDANVAAARFGTPERFAFTGAHGDTVEGYVVTPADFDAARKYPVAFLIHGGPQGSFGNDFHYRWNPQAYAGAGYAVVTVDFHGSTGYGQAFTDAINDDWGGAPYEDLMKGLDYALAHYPFLDGTRVGGLGASYGGYMINWILGHTDRFTCLVCHDGNLDERMAYYDTEELWFPEWDHRGTPWDNPEGYAKVNPVEFVKNWKTPTLVIHGEKDFRIPYSQGIGTFTALQRKGIPSKLLIFPDENHFVLKPANSILWHETVIGWLDHWLKGKD
ncbi:MAG: prolyl oligopeptidase family serine peptidase [Acidobacteriota bacterium]